MAGQVVTPVGVAHCGDLCREGGDEGQTVGVRGGGGGCGGLGGHVAGACVLAGLVVVLYQRVDDAADAQREIYHVRGGFSDRISLAGEQEGGAWKGKGTVLGLLVLSSNGIFENHAA